MKVWQALLCFPVAYRKSQMVFWKKPQLLGHSSESLYYVNELLQSSLIWQLPNAFKNMYVCFILV